MRTAFKALIAVSLTIASCVAAAQDTLRVVVFPGAHNLALMFGMERGIFAKHGLKVEIENTPNSDALRNGLAEGRFDIAHAVIDNAVAMVEKAHQDVLIVAGEYDGGSTELIVRPEIGGFSDLRGKMLAVDAPDTAFALVAKKILKNNGLLEGRDYTVRAVGGTLQRAQEMRTNPELAASMLNPPFSITATGSGLKSLGRQRDLIGPYQAGGVLVMRQWAQANGDKLERYLAALIESMRIALDPANRSQAATALAARFKLDPDVARQTVERLAIPGLGLAPDARLDVDGFRAALAIRAEMEGQWGGKPPPPDKYLDLAYYGRALERLERR